MSVSNNIVGRLAPSPTGSLHIGNIRTFLWAWLSARKKGGKVILRIEDLEKPAGPGVLEEMLSDLSWLGFDWDEGPVWDPGLENAFRQRARLEIPEQGPNGPYVQSHRRDFYSSNFKTLQLSNSIYPCVCSRQDILSSQSAPQEGDRELRYPGTCRGRFESYEEAAAFIKDGRKPVWRFRVDRGPVEFDDLFSGRHRIDVDSDCGDFVAFKSPEQPSYQTAVVVDDIAMGVNEVVRGDDLIPSTARQILLYRAFGCLPPRYGHVPLVVGPDGKRLAKRHGDFRISSLRGKIRPEKIISILARWSGLACPGFCGPKDLLGSWDWRILKKEIIVLDDGLIGELSST